MNLDFISFVFKESVKPIINIIHVFKINTTEDKPIVKQEHALFSVKTILEKNKIQ